MWPDWGITPQHIKLFSARLTSFLGVFLIALGTSPQKASGWIEVALTTTSPCWSMEMCYASGSLWGDATVPADYVMTKMTMTVTTVPHHNVRNQNIKKLSGSHLCGFPDSIKAGNHLLSISTQRILIGLGAHDQRSRLGHVCLQLLQLLHKVRYLRKQLTYFQLLSTQAAKSCRRRQTSPPVPPPGDLDQTTLSDVRQLPRWHLANWMKHMPSFILVYWLHYIKTWCHPQNRNYVMYCTEIIKQTKYIIRHRFTVSVCRDKLYIIMSRSLTQTFTSKRLLFYN